MNGTEDSVIVARILAGRPDSFTVLVERYYETVQMVALAKTGNGADAEDVAQETFVNAYTRLGTLREQNKLANWLVNVARNTAVSLVRKRERERRNAPEAHLHGNSSPDPARRERLESVARQVEGLPVPLREVVLLHYFEGLKCREIAERLGMSTNAVVKRLARGRDVLGDRLLREWGESKPAREDNDASVARVMGVVGALPMPDWSGQVAAAMPGSGGMWGLGGVIASKAFLMGATLVLIAVGSATWWFNTHGSSWGSDQLTAGPPSDDKAKQPVSETADGGVLPNGSKAGRGTDQTPTVEEEESDSGRPDRRSERTTAFGGSRTETSLVAALPEVEAGEEEEGEEDEGPLLGTIEGRVIAGDTQQPVAGATVSARGNNASGTGESDGNGGFIVEIRGPNPEDEGGEPPLFMVSAEKEGLVSDTQLRVPLDSGGVILTLTDNGMVRGVALDGDTGRPLRNFEARISRQRAGSEGIMGSGLPWSAFESESGFFELPTQADLGVISVRAKGYREMSLTLDLPRGEVLDDVEVRLAPGTAFRGIVLDGASHEPVAGASVGMVTGEVRQWWGINEGNFSINTVTDQEGVFEIREADGALPFDLVVWHGNYAPTFVIDLDVSYQREIRLNLSQGGELHGTVTRDGEALSGLRIWAGLSFGRPMEHTAQGAEQAVFLALSGTGNAGEYTFSRMPPGRYQVRVMDADANTPLAKRYLTRRWVNIIDGEATVEDFRIETEGYVGGVVTGLSNMDGVELRLYDQEFPEQTLYSTAERHDSAAPDPTGNFQFPPVPEGAYLIRGSIPGRPEALAEVYFDIVAGERSDVELPFVLPEEPTTESEEEEGVE